VPGGARIAGRALPGLSMSWAIVIENLPEYPGFTEEIVAKMLSSHIAYPFDAQIALKMAREAKLSSATLAGGRTPNPYGGDEIIDISVHGFAEARDFVNTMRHIVVLPEEPK
jgi:hypothetical protein